MTSKPVISHELNFDPYIDAVLTSKSWAAHHLDNFDHFIDIGLKQIICDLTSAGGTVINKRPPKNGGPKISTIDYVCTFTHIDLERPAISMPNSGERQPLYPNLARINSYTYSSNLLVDFKIIATAHIADSDDIIVREESDGGFHIASMPIPVGCKRCNTYGMSPEELLNVQEDPQDIDGYFVIKGNEWVIDLNENMAFNKFHCYRNVGYKDELCRGDFISKPGDDYEHSNEHIFKILNTGAIIIRFNHFTFNDLELPFYVYLRLLGDITDKDIIDNITQKPSADVDMINIIVKALRQEAKFPGVAAMRDRVQILDHLAGIIYRPGADGKLPNAQVVRDQLMYKIDRTFLPHIGIGPKFRIKKFRFVCDLVRHLILTYLGVIHSTDRDSYTNKRLSAAGVSYSKIFKRKFNRCVTKPIIKEMESAFETMDFADVPLIQTFRSAVKATTLQQELMQIITSSSLDDKNPGNQKARSRLSTQQLLRKNELNQISIMRTIRSPNTNQATSKSDIRADLLRRVQTSYYDLVCPIQSPDTGMMVGVTKQMGVAAALTSSSSGEFLKSSLLSDADITSWETNCPMEFFNKHLYIVYVNGDIVGGVQHPYAFVRKWQLYRRQSLRGEMKIHPNTSVTVEYETGRVKFYTDMGRIIHPVIIVVNNERDPEHFETKYDPLTGEGFEQKILLTAEHIVKLMTGDMTVEDLLVDGIIEYISAEESEICLMALTHEQLLASEHDPTMQFTHCDVPQFMLGLVGHITPLAEHNQLVRNAYNTNQTKQAGGQYVGTWFWRIDKQKFLLYRCETPGVVTLANRYVKPNGGNVMYSLACMAGANQEDSLVGNETSFETGMLTGAYFTFLMTELDKNEKFEASSEHNTLGLSVKSSREHLENGVARKGSIVRKNDVIISKTVTFERPVAQRFKCQDRSILWPYDEMAMVGTTVRSYNQDGKQFIKVQLSSELPVEKGDKMCLTPDAEVMTLNRGWVPIANIDGEDLIATLTQQGVIEYHKPNATIVMEYDSDIVIFSGPDVYARVTPPHRMPVVTARNKCCYELTTAKRMLNDLCERKPFLFTGDWQGGSEIQPGLPFRFDRASCEELAELNCDTIRQYIKPGTYAMPTDPNVIGILCLHAGYCMQVHGDSITIKTAGELIDTAANYIVSAEHYKGNVYCLTVPNSVFYVRQPDMTESSRTMRPMWTGNSSRFGQKGVISNSYRREDLFTTPTGLVPDIIMNPNSIPTRMTLGQLTESAAGLLAAHKGVNYDGTVFKSLDNNEIGRELEKNGYHRHGTSIMYNGMTGEVIKSQIFFGVVFYQRLNKFSKDSKKAVTMSRFDILTRQPEGGGPESGLRMGEMERDCLMAHGANLFFMTKFLDDSDGFNVYYCRNCNNECLVNEKKKFFKCNQCTNADIVRIRMPWANQLLFKELGSCHVGLYITPSAYQIDRYH